jgi:hypothetical protein
MTPLDSFVEIRLKAPEDFLKVKETLERVGLTKRDSNVLCQLCHILHKRGKYYVVHYKQMLQLDGHEAVMSEDDVGKLNKIVSLLSDWKLCMVVKPESIKEPSASMKHIKVISHVDREKWRLVSNYSVGVRK